MSADSAAGAQVDGHQLAYLAQFEAGSKRQGEKNKCATVRKSAFFNFAVNRFVENIRSVNEEYAKLGVLFTQAHARCEECLKEAKDEHRRHVEQEEKSYGGMVKLNKIVEQYQLNRISTMPRSEHARVEAENTKLLAELQVLHDKCWNFEARVSQECSRLGLRQKSGRKKNPENQPQDNPFSPIQFSMIPPVKYHRWYHGVSLWWYHELVVFCWWYQARDTTSSVNQWRDTT